MVKFRLNNGLGGYYAQSNIDVEVGDTVVVGMGGALKVAEITDVDVGVSVTNETWWVIDKVDLSHCKERERRLTELKELIDYGKRVLDDYEDEYESLGGRL